MELVIKIDEKIYHALKNNNVMIGSLRSGKTIWTKILTAISTGTPLPKGHGRLIDADDFHHTLEDMPVSNNDKWFNCLQKACNRLAEASTIVKADNMEGEHNG